MRAIPGTITAHLGVEPGGHNKHAGKKYPAPAPELAEQVESLTSLVSRLIVAINNINVQLESNTELVRELVSKQTSSPARWIPEPRMA